MLVISAQRCHVGKNSGQEATFRDINVCCHIVSLCIKDFDVIITVTPGDAVIPGVSNRHEVTLVTEQHMRQLTGIRHTQDLVVVTVDGEHLRGHLEMARVSDINTL